MPHPARQILQTCPIGGDLGASDRGHRPAFGCCRVVAEDPAQREPSDAWSWPADPYLLLLAALLVPVNWGIESIKWAEPHALGPMDKPCRQVLYGTAWSLIGPLRLGAAPWAGSPQ